MEVLLISFVILTSCICFFGTKIANWLSDEDSTGGAAHTLQPNSADNMYAMYPPRHQPGPRHVQSFRHFSASANSDHLPVNRRYGSPVRHRAA